MSGHLPRRAQTQSVHCAAAGGRRERSLQPGSHLNTVYDTGRDQYSKRGVLHLLDVYSQVCVFVLEQETLVDLVLTATDIWAVWLDNDNQTVVKYISFEQ